ncbi:MAG: hypothetical protein ACOC85_01100 [Thermoplasmatota archaeon]
MKIIAVATDNFKFYYDIVKELKQRDIPFISISPTDPIPENVDIILTTKEEAEGINFEKIVPISEDIRKGVRKALSMSSDKESYQQMIVGIDPGSRPGVALVGDGKILEKEYAKNPEDVKRIVENYITGYKFDDLIVRIGHGDKTNRNRTINSLKSLALMIEIVNEEDTTHQGDFPDLEAAREIALTKGEFRHGPYIVEATEGEKREMQRRSRIRSEGEITISKDLAKKVVEGKIDLKEAIKRQKGGKEKDI